MGTALTSDGATLLVGEGNNGRVRVWDTASGTETALYAVHYYEEYNSYFRTVDIALSPDDSTLATLGGEGPLRIWDPVTGANLITGIFLDIDHYIDYTAECGIRFNIKNFFKVCDEELTKRVFVLLHSWELLVLTFSAAWLLQWNPWVTGLSIGYMHHMVTDQYVNAPYKGSYFLAYRVWHKFDRRKTFRVNEHYIEKT